MLRKFFIIRKKKFVFGLVNSKVRTKFQKPWFRGPAVSRQTDPTESWFNRLAVSCLGFCVKYGRLGYAKPPQPQDRNIGGITNLRLAVGQQKPQTAGLGFTMLETLIGLALVSATGFVVTFMSANMITLSKKKQDSYACSSVASSVMSHFYGRGDVLSSKRSVSTIIKKSEGGGAQI